MKDVIKYKEYLGSVHFSAEDEVFYGKIEGVDDLVTFEGKTVNELKQAFTEAVEDYDDLCIKTGKSGEKSYKGSFNVRIAPELHREAARKSIELGISLNQLVEKAIRQMISIRGSGA
ncbi:MAG: type II toxin-antitoxin system HicB family antitoxin [Porphyromonadaceae bacterium]|nr:MAG: type II toxin-antitoxin system HicB family antitoxin [Porphyromonadaceae bacterium]